ncbi:MAG TPA: type II toxin-antitoxin system HicA family toxin [Dehalococcoidia bacterium]|nr:type II toxin-antitoxin system HicA family toxin [Dehalococcoidia bacterium]
MAELPVVSGRAAVRAFEKAGWTYKRTTGDHMILAKPGARNNLSVPDHRELDRGILRKLIAAAGMTVDEFVELSRR